MTNYLRRQNHGHHRWPDTQELRSLPDLCRLGCLNFLFSMSNSNEAKQRPIRPGGDYDLLPYPSMPITHTQPAHLAALTALFGIAAPAVDRARVLELGCASGGNIIPLAARFANASFTGIDLSPRQIDDGRKTIALLALDNITLHQGDLASLTLSKAPFDYVICHGVFSWVPRPVQDAIFRICRDVLAPDGVATISYNVFPGWHLRMVIRDLCLQYAGQADTPQSRVGRARAALESIAQSSSDNEPYGLLLRTEASRLKQMPAAYILGEFLAPYNAPCFVRDFIGRARQNGLHYLCEADLSAAVPLSLDPAVRARIASHIDADAVAAEQHIDFLTGRPFRCSVLIRRQPEGDPRPPSADRLRTLHLASPLSFDIVQTCKDGGADRLDIFRNDRARGITNWDPAIHQALIRLAAAYPATLTLDELTASVGCDSAARAGIEARLCDALFSMVMAGQASVSVLPLRLGLATQMLPRAWVVARMEAASGQPWITSLRHVGVPVYPILKILLPYLDGTHARSALQARLTGALQSGAVQLPEQPAQNPPQLPQTSGSVVEHHVERALCYLARHALLEPDTTTC